MSYRAGAPDDAARIIVTGRLDDAADIARHLRLCDVVLQPSVWDGMPNAMLEAMACGALVLASDAGGMTEAIDHETHGFILPNALLNHLGEATLEVLDLPEARRRVIVEAARERICHAFCADAEADALARVLQRLRVSAG
jgi:glycosyltransferase involved in cell wall biosynthesis